VKKKVAVQEFIDTLDHPLKSEVQRIRETIKGVNPDITEEIKWNAPSFSYKGNYLVTFNLRATQHVHLVFHNSEIPKYIVSCWKVIMLTGAWSIFLICRMWSPKKPNWRQYCAS
jgi:uncharacterized protein YdhG (YjbR/CyaY superfamily)